VVTFCLFCLPHKRGENIIAINSLHPLRIFSKATITKAFLTFLLQLKKVTKKAVAAEKRLKIN